MNNRDGIVKNLCRSYTDTIQRIQRARNDRGNKSRGTLRGEKGRLVEHQITEPAIRQVWAALGGNASRLNINRKKIRVRSQNGVWWAAVDEHVFIDDIMVLAVEDKAYSEMAMMKRIFTDMRYIRRGLQMSQKTTPACALVQLEYMWGAPKRTSEQLAFLQDDTGIELSVFTLLDDPVRRMNRPIHDPKFHKDIAPKQVREFVDYLFNTLSPFV